jgi:hypothetical protein
MLTIQGKVTDLYTAPPAGQNRVESLYAMLTFDGPGKEVAAWQETVKEEFFACVLEEDDLCLRWEGRRVTEPNYSLFHASFLQITYYDFNGDYCGLLTWKEWNGEVFAWGCVPFPVPDGGE